MNIAHRLDSSERTKDVIVCENISFEGLLLSRYTLDGLKICGFHKPSPIQLKAIPLGKCGFDLIIEAKSGTGKTAVFGIIALEMINLDIGCQVLVLAPTREIASQIAQVLTAIGCCFQGLKVEIVMGGTDLKGDVQRLKGNRFQILVGSPGRMKHLIKENVFSTDAIRLIVIDEADKLTEDSFSKDINYIFSKLPHRKQVIASSATYTQQIKDLLSNFMRSASHVRPHSSNVLLGVSQYSSIVALHHNSVRQKKIIFDELLRLLSKTPFKQCLIFTNHQIVAKNLCKSLVENGWPARSLSGIQSQTERLDSLHALQTFSCRILVATDLAARGIDAANVDLVINFDPPYDLPTYLHRIGRSGRYGSKGTAVTVLPAGKELENFHCLLKDIGPPLVDIKSNEQLIVNVSNKKGLNDPQLDFTKSEILNLTVSTSGKEKTVESFDDILMSRDQFIADDSQTGKYFSKGTTVSVLPAGKDLENLQCLKKIKLKSNEQLNVDGSNKKDLNRPYLDSSKSEILNLTVSTSDNKKTVESFADILMSRDQFDTDNGHDSLERFNSLIYPFDEFSKTNNDVDSEANVIHVDYNISNFLSQKNVTFLERDSSQTSNRNSLREQNDLHKYEDNFFQQIKNRCTINQNHNFTKHSPKKKDIDFSKTVASGCVKSNYIISDSISQPIDSNCFHNRVVIKRHKQMPKDPVNHLSLDDYNNFKLKLSLATQKIQSSVYINTLLDSSF